jgi:hypothetical protein
MKELIEQPVSKVGKEMKLEKQNVQAPQIDQEIWTYQKVMETFKVPAKLKKHIQKLFDNDSTLTTLNLPCTSH